MTTSTDHTARAGAAPSGTRVRYRSDVSLVSMLAGEVRIVGPKDETGGAEMLDEAGASMDYRNAAQLEGDEFWGDFEFVAAAPTEAAPTVQLPTREQIAEAIYTMRAGSKQNWHKAAFRDDYLKEADAVLALFPQPTPSAEATAKALRRLREAVEEISHTPIMYGGGDEVTMRMSELGARIKAARDAAELLPIPGADPVLTPGQRTVLREAANAYDGPLERVGRHDARRLLGRAIERIMRREGE